MAKNQKKNWFQNPENHNTYININFYRNNSMYLFYSAHFSGLWRNIFATEELEIR